MPSLFVASSKIAFVNSLLLSEVMVAGHPKIGIHQSVRASVRNHLGGSVSSGVLEIMYCREDFLPECDWHYRASSAICDICPHAALAGDGDQFEVN